MPAVAIPLVDLSQRIAQQESDLQKLRQDYEARQTELIRLNRQKQDLASQLQRIEADIQAVSQGNTAHPATPPAKATTKVAVTPPSKPAAVAPAAKPAAVVSAP